MTLRLTEFEVPPAALGAGAEDPHGDVIRLVLDEGNGVATVARELDLVPSALGQWVRQAQADRSKGRTGLRTA